MKAELAVGEDAGALIVEQTVEVAVAEAVAPLTIYHIVQRKTLAEVASEAVVVVGEVDTLIKDPLSSRMSLP